MDAEETQWMKKIPWYNKTICTIFNIKSFKDYLKTGRKDRYDLMCSIDAYDTDHVSIPDYASSGSVIPM